MIRSTLWAAFVAALLHGPAFSDEAVYLGSYHWTYPEWYFGGLSGLEVSEDGREILVIGDAGQVIQGTIERAGNQITGVTFDAVKGLKTPSGDRVRGLDEFDAEGLAGTPGGQFYVSFEHVGRIWSYQHWQAPAIALPKHPDFAGLPENGGLETLAIDSIGRLYTIPERGFGARQVYRYADGAWTTFGQLDVDSGFWPVGGDIGPDGMFYLLERRYFPIFGFSSRLRRLRIGSDGLAAPETLFETRFGTHDNLEGVAVWTPGDGSLRLTLVSDDNRSRFQRTELVEYALPGALAPDDATR